MNIEKYLEQTKFYKEGGSCFECCEYEGMVADLLTTLTAVAEEARREERKRIADDISEYLESYFFPRCK
jgi:hypothetical protein